MWIKRRASGQQSFSLDLNRVLHRQGHRVDHVVFGVTEVQLVALSARRRRRAGHCRGAEAIVVALVIVVVSTEGFSPYSVNRGQLTACNCYTLFSYSLLSDFAPSFG